jgi:hypothetical protein
MPANISPQHLAEDGRIHAEILRQNWWEAIYTNVFKSGWFPAGMGDEVNYMTLERTLPNSAPVWSTISFNDGDGNNCVPTAVKIRPGQTLQATSLQQTALESDPICINDIRGEFQIAQQLQGSISNLADNVTQVWEDRKRDEYTRVAANKLIFNDAVTTGSATFPLVTPDYGPSQLILDYVYTRLSRRAGRRGAVGAQGTKPIYAAYMSPEASDIITRDDEQIREDFRYSPQVAKLMDTMGQPKTFRGFAHYSDMQIPRWNFVDGAWVRVPAFANTATTNGNKADFTDDYLEAEFEDILIVNLDVMECLYPEPAKGLGKAELNQDPALHRGTFRWIKPPSDTNPDEDWGYFRAKLQYATRPLFPQYGYVIRVKRCQPDGTKSTCPST